MKSTAMRLRVWVNQRNGAASTKVTEPNLPGIDMNAFTPLRPLQKLHPTFPHPLHFSHVRYAPGHENGGRILRLRRIRHGDLNFHIFLVRISAPKADSAPRHIKACHDVRPKLRRFHTGGETHSRPRATPPLEARPFAIRTSPHRQHSTFRTVPRKPSMDLANVILKLATRYLRPLAARNALQRQRHWPRIRQLRRGKFR